MSSLLKVVLSTFVLQAWVTLGRAQLNFGEPDSAIESFDRALAIKVKQPSKRSLTSDISYGTSFVLGPSLWTRHGSYDYVRYS